MQCTPEVLGGELLAQQHRSAAYSIPDDPAALGDLGNELEGVMPPLVIGLAVTLHEAGDASVKGCESLWPHNTMS